MNTVNVEMFAHYIFSRISHRVLDARKYDLSVKINYYNRINCHTCKNLSMLKCHLGLDA